MKRFILSALLLAFTSIFVFGCSDSGDDSSSAVPVATPINLSNPDSLVGTYEISLFYTEAGAGGTYDILTNNCSASISNGFTTSDKCKDEDNVQFKGEGIIFKDADGAYQIITKVQMAGGILGTGDFGKTAVLLGNDYNYTVFTPIPKSAITNDGVNVGDTAVKGTNGRSRKQLSPSPEDTYTFVVQPDGSLRNNMKNNIQKGIAPDVPVYTIMKKVSDTPKNLDPNSPYSSPNFPEGQKFDTEIKYTAPVIP